MAKYRAPVERTQVSKHTHEAALAAAGGDARRLIVMPESIVVVNYPRFPVDHWTKRAWRA